MAKPLENLQKPAQLRSRLERYQAGKALRTACPRESQARLGLAPTRADPVDLLIASSVGRIAELLPIRYGRMLASPFSFFRGAASVMASDLSHTPDSGITVQACGDCHLLNFGAFSTPERRIVFDINDFDETHPAPWEWDLKRLATSFVIASQHNGHSAPDCRATATAVAHHYREKLQELAQQPTLEAWHSYLDYEKLIAMTDDAALKQRHKRALKKALAHERRVLLERYTLADLAIKVVGVGSVGLLCAVALLFASEDDPLFLQVKEARDSVLAPYVRAQAFATHGERVVFGQRLMQAASDVFLGHTVSARGMHFYVRQLRDVKVKPMVETFTPQAMRDHARNTGWALARAHARSGDAALMVGYIGRGAAFSKAIANFAVLYSAQNARDHAALLQAVRLGRVQADTEDR